MWRKIIFLLMAIELLRNHPPPLMTPNMVSSRRFPLYSVLVDFSSMLFVFTSSLFQILDNMLIFYGRFPLRGRYASVRLDRDSNPVFVFLGCQVNTFKPAM